MRHEKGFILADTLIALTIVALLLTSLFAAVRLLNKASTSSASELEARLIAQALIVNHTCPARSGRQEGEISDYSWTCSEEIEALESSDRLQVRSTTLALEWGWSNEIRTFEVTKSSLEAGAT